MSTQRLFILFTLTAACPHFLQCLVSRLSDVDQKYNKFQFAAVKLSKCLDEGFI